MWRRSSRFPRSSHPTHRTILKVETYPYYSPSVGFQSRLYNQPFEFEWGGPGGLVSPSGRHEFTPKNEFRSPYIIAHGRCIPTSKSQGWKSVAGDKQGGKSGAPDRQDGNPKLPDRQSQENNNFMAHGRARSGEIPPCEHRRGGHEKRPLNTDSSASMRRAHHRPPLPKKKQTTTNHRSKPGHHRSSSHH